jgi:protein SCO1/2
MQSQVVGEAKIGGPFVMVDDEGRPVTSAHLLGRYNLIYFGFTYCPDICPYELKKMSNVITNLGSFRRKWCGNKLGNFCLGY